MSRATDTSREWRLWISLLAWLAATGVVIATDPYVRTKMKSAANGVKKKATEFKDHVKAKRKERKEKKAPHIEVVSSEIIHQEPL
jgi:hypothetical protein